MIFGRIKPRKYDHIISLGYNCEVSFRIKDFFGTLESYPFTWVYINNQIYSFVDILDNFDRLLLKKNNLSVVPWGMILDKKYNILFHTKGNVEEMFDEDKTPIKSIVNLRIAELKSRYRHLCVKFNNLLFSNDWTLFVMKVDVEHGYDIKNIIKFVKKINCRHILVKYVKKFANDAHTDTDGDLEGWSDLFKSVCLN